MTQSKAKALLRRLKKNEITFFLIPEEYKNHPLIAAYERKIGLRITGKRGFDIISNSFFVEESLIPDPDKAWKEDVCETFYDFDSYFDYLDGDVYDNACYTFCPVSKLQTSRKIDIDRLMTRKAFVENTIDEYSLALSDKEKESYESGKQVHELCKQWIKKFNKCTNGDKLAKVIKSYRKSEIASVVDLDFFFFQYIFVDRSDKQRLSVIMEYMSSYGYPIDQIIKALCSIYDPEEVVRLLKGSPEVGKTIYRYKARLKEYVSWLKEGKARFRTRAYFDPKTQYYCQEFYGYRNNDKVMTICVYFETFDEFVAFRKDNLREDDLTYCDLSGALGCNVDFSGYVVDETTRLPISTNTDTTCSQEKRYSNGKFYVTQQWVAPSGGIIRRYDHCFDRFFDFVAFLKGDLSGADLTLCSGLQYLEDWSNIDFTGSKMISSLCEKFSLEYTAREANSDLLGSFDRVEQNENETAMVLQSSRDLVEDAIEKDLSSLRFVFNYRGQEVCYISDLHLLHRIQQAGCRSEEDVKYLIQKIVNNLAEEVGNLLLIGGDVASDIKVFQLFIKLLSEAPGIMYNNTRVVFTLGNHELWGFPDLQIDQIVLKYRTILEEHNMYLLHNDLFYEDGTRETHLIKYQDLCQMDETQISECLRSARYVILGGLGFSGYNTDFNADNGIYRSVIDRTAEIKESKIFEDLYDQLKPILDNKNTIILTHTPKKDWCREADPDKNYVYVSGHTHRNFFYDDGENRIYSDNQVGYHNETLHLKSFWIDNGYDCFSDYGDGIFDVTSKQYNDFYRGKNISMTFQREINVLYMLKKNGYYCFIHAAKNGNLSILNGGTMKKLESKNILYYYNNMDAMISTIKTPLDKFVSRQQRIADTVKRIGGDGTIHGCIIDIDFYNHIYLNPFDSSITGYWATNIIDKVVYPSVPNLLEVNCPAMFDEYVKLLKDGTKNPLVPRKQTTVDASTQIYLDTNIYKASREIAKMQRLYSNILTSWSEDALHKRTRIKLS